MTLKEIATNLEKITQKPNPTDSLSLIEGLRTLDGFVKDPKAGIPKKLLHYLEKRSYEKALLFINEQLAQ